MGNLINKKTLIDSETGEILKEDNWLGYDGFSEKGYQYRRKSIHVKYYYDALPDNIDQETFFLLIMMAELMNEENMLVYKVKRKSKFRSIVYKPMTKEDIAERIRFHYGKNKFDRCWTKLKKHYIKKIKYYDYYAWAINPAIISKCKFVPLWLYEEFKTYMNPFLSASVVKKMQDKIENLYADEKKSV